MVLILGPQGVGKTQVARRLAAWFQRGSEAAHEAVCYLTTAEFTDRWMSRISQRRWSSELLSVPELIIDGPVWLKNRPAATQALIELIDARASVGLRTFVVQADDDGSIESLMAVLAIGSTVTLCLRFPKGAQGRLRFARRLCEELHLSRSAARGTEDIEPWNYDTLRAALIAKWGAPPSTAGQVDTRP